MDFPCRYLGLPFSVRKLTKEQIQPIIDKIANQLPGWKADLMTRAGRVVQVQYVLTAMLVYLAMSTKLLTRFEEDSFGGAGRKLMEGTASLLGLKCVALGNLAA
jgi:hypothetical protein